MVAYFIVNEAKMKQTGNANLIVAHNSNNVMVGDVEQGSSLNVNQNCQLSASLTDQHIVYDVDPCEDFIEYTDSYVLKKVLFSIAPIVIAGLAVYADILSVATYFGLSKLTLTTFVLTGAAFFVVVNAKFFSLLMLPVNDRSASYVRGEFVEKTSNGKYLLYKKTAQCIYPKCAGTVRVVPAPPRERPNHQFVGVCSVGDKQHTYTCDYNGIGFPCRFDWRPLD